MPLTEAVQGYIRDVLSALPDEVISHEAFSPLGEQRQLANPLDPSQGFVEEEEMPEDPWEAEAFAPGTEVLPDFLDIEALRRRSQG